MQPASPGLRLGLLVSLLIHSGALWGLSHWQSFAPPRLPHLAGQGTVVSIAAPDSAAGFEALELPTDELLEPDVEIHPTQVVIADRRYELTEASPVEQLAPPMELLAEVTPVDSEQALAETMGADLPDRTSQNSGLNQDERSPSATGEATETTQNPPSSTEPPHKSQAQPQQKPPRPIGGIPSRASLAQSPGESAQDAPSIVFNPPPDYPIEAQQRRWQGLVLLRFQVTTEGRVADLEVLATSGHALLDAAAVRAVRQWVFEPARQSGRPVSVTVRLPLRFRLP